MVYCADKLIENSLLLKVILYKSNRPLFYGFTGVITHLGTREKLVNHAPSARDLQAFLVFFQHPAWVITPVNP